MSLMILAEICERFYNNYSLAAAQSAALREGVVTANFDLTQPPAAAPARLRTPCFIAEP